MLDYPEDNTDDEQEELPFDDDIQNIFQHNCESQNVKDLTSIESIFTLPSPEISCHSEEQPNCQTQLHQRIKIHLTSTSRHNDIELAMATEKELSAGDFNNSRKNPCFSGSNISDVLSRHFPKEELSASCQLIDCETIPEISFTESFDETILNKIKISESIKISSPNEKSHIEEIERAERCESIDKNWDLMEEKQLVIDDKRNFSCEIKDCKENNPQFVNRKEETMSEKLSYFSNPEEEYQEQKCFLETSGSSHKFRYGQRQVNYQLPDFSKVAPKVKIPKGNNKSTPIIKRTKSSPDLLSKSTIVKDILEEMNYLDCVAMKKQEENVKMPELDLQLELLTKQAEAQNCIDHQRFNTKMLPSPNTCSPNLGIKARGAEITSEISTVPSVTVPRKSMLDFSQTSISELPSRRMVSPLPSACASIASSPLLQKATEGEKLSLLLKEQTEELKTKVEMFSKYVAQDVLFEEHHQILKLLKEHLTQLEWNYLDAKEKHCALHLQNFRHSSTNFGEFDLDRSVEGEIFKLGMLLEDIKEKIDEMGSPNYSTSATSPSLTPSVCSYYSSGPESPVISGISESLSKTAPGENICKNEKYGENRNQAVEVIPQRKHQQPTQSGRCHPVPQDQLELPKRTAYEQQIVEPLEKSRLPANEQSTYCYYFSSGEGTGRLQSHRQFPTSQNDNSDQENTDGSWEMKSPPPANPYSTSNQGSNTTDLPVLKKQGSLGYPSDHLFFEGLENSAKEHNIIIRPRLKTQLSNKPNKQIYSSSSNRNKMTECTKTKAYKEKFSILQGSTLDLDGSACSHKKTLALQRFYFNKQPEEFIYKLSERQNLHIPKSHYSRMYDTIILSPQYLDSRNAHGRSMSERRNKRIEDTKSKILNSTLDHVIQTANNLRRTTEHMVQVVSEDLARAKTQTPPNVTANQYYI
ncbi:protein AKNAD1 isoform X2 [Sphaerodactylus townsendi]|uniref:protein AKNAD1 isoform X2 n=1 Tax=Sphaerodactylus townsendi TaxID=933632 RepID=UPI002026A9AD|nr:protein AKNAD1 isoform X2 [Sphaerodactylus townsendi]